MMAQAKDAIDQILNAEDLFARLGFKWWTDAPIECVSVRKRYKEIARIVHPDKCKEDSRATLAFQLLSEAFDEIGESEDVQKEYLGELKQLRESKGHVVKRRKKEKKKSKQWWEEKSFDEIEKEIRRREAQEEMMRKQFVRNQSNQFLVKKKKALLEKIARVMNRLSEKEEEFVVEDVEDFDKEIIQKTETLRSQFFYCIYCGAQFRDKDELQKVCPGNNEDLHG